MAVTLQSIKQLNNPKAKGKEKMVVKDKEIEQGNPNQQNDEPTTKGDASGSKAQPPINEEIPSPPSVVKP